MPRATVIHEKNLDMIAEVNEGVQPSAESVANHDWYVDNQDPDIPNVILSKFDFFEKYYVPLYPSPHYSIFVSVTER